MKDNFTKNFVSEGKVEWIGLRTKKGGKVIEVTEAELNTSNGLDGDYYNKADGNRMVTLIQKEHLSLVEKMLGKTELDPSLVRRNIVVSDLNLLALKNKTFQVGNSQMEFTGYAYPCRQMETNLGKGGYNAMVGHGGITARVLKSGKISIGSSVKSID